MCTILVPWWFIIISSVFFYLCNVLLSGFLQFKRNFVDDQNNLKYRDGAYLKYVAKIACRYKLVRCLAPNIVERGIWQLLNGEV